MSDFLQVYQLVKHFPVRRGLLRSRREVVHAVDGISFSLEAEETLGLVGSPVAASPRRVEPSCG